MPTIIPGQSSEHGRPLPLHSLRLRLPLFFGALIILLLVSFLWASYREVESTLVGAGVERAHSAADEIARTLSRSVQNLVDQTARLAEEPALVAYLRDPTSAARDAARQALEPALAAGVRRYEVWDASDSLLLELTSQPGDPSSRGLGSYPRGQAPVYAGVGPIRAEDGLHYFDLAVPIREREAPASARPGHLRRFGQFVVSEGNPVRRLLGSEARLKVGAADGVWTDLGAVVGPPPDPDEEAGAGEFRDDAGRRWVGAGTAIAGTPWTVWVGYPRPLVVAPAQNFLQRMLLVVLLFVAVSVALAASLGIRITRPLRALAGAAAEIAGGDYSRRVENGRRDEIGRLSDAFNTMADRVQEAHGALRETHEHTHFSLAAARIGVWESELASGRVSCSESMRLVHGLGTGPLPATREAFLDLVHPDDRDSVRRVLEGRDVEDEIFSRQFRALSADASIQWIEARGRIKLDDAGRPASVRGVSVDITERRRLEQQLRHAQKMEAFGQLAGGVAHDFNNLLTAIVGHGNLLLSELNEADGAREDVVEILKAGESGARLTRQLLAFSRRQVMRAELIAAGDVIASTEKLLRRLIGADIQLVTATAPDLHHIRADPGYLEQVLVNLAVNARDAMRDGGRLTIAASNVVLSDTYRGEHGDAPPGAYVVLSVSDTGTGMDAETKAHLFEPFFTTKAPGEGTGLGLATVFGIIKQSGGHIYVYSEPGLGTTFKIYLPAIRGKRQAAADQAADPQTPGGTETILVVEDDDAVRAIATTILERMGYRITVAASGEEALRLLEAGEMPPDLVVSDVIMPGMTGPELARQLATRYPTLKVLFTSGYSGDALGRHGLEETDTMFIEKPYTPAALAKKVREALGVTART